MGSNKLLKFSSVIELYTKAYDVIVSDRKKCFTLIIKHKAKSDI